TNLFNKINTSLEVETEVDKSPSYTLSLVFLLFENEHVMVEKLLEFFIYKVNPELFETV
ncbi:hypothetical protein Mgra_00005904, partial [Meloidogyne graminicola]